MKQITLLLAAAILAGNASARLTNVSKPMGTQTSPAFALSKASVPTKKIPAPSDDQEIIWEAPEGKLTYYSRTCIGYREYFGSIMPLLDEGSVVTVIEQEDGTVWMHNTISQFLAPGWVKAEKNGNTLTITGPQLVYQETNYDTDEIMNYYVSPVTIEKYTDGEGSEYVKYTPSEDGAFTFDINPETGTIKEAGNGDLILGIISWNEKDGFYWVGYGDNYVVCSLPKVEPVTVPESAEIHKNWAMRYYSTDTWGDEYEYAKFVDLAIEGNDYYIKGIYPSLPDNWIKGTKDENNVVTFPNGQYLGINFEILRFAYLAAGNVEYDPENDIDLAIIDEEGVAFELDKDSSMTALTNILIIPVAETNVSNANYIDYLEAATIIPQDPDNISTPKAPSDMFLGGIDGTGALECDMPAEDINGNILNPGYLYYSVYVNSDIYTFLPDYYDIFYEPTVEVPYAASDDFSIYAEGSWRTVYIETIPASDIKNIGAQTIYYPEGKDINPDNALKSDIIMIGEDIPATGVEGVMADRRVEKVEYFNLQGHRVSNPSAGLYLTRITFYDGTTSTRKISIK